MSEKNKAESDLETRLTQLSLAVKRSQSIIDSGKRVAIQRHLEALQTTAKETSRCKLVLEAIKIAGKEEQTVIDEWSKLIDQKFDAADEATMRHEKWLADADKAEQFVTQEEQLQFELKLHEKKLQMQAELAKSSVQKPEIQECDHFATQSAKLPKLVISKFDGCCMNWPKFWGQFSEAIDKSSVAPITKFTYLLELLEPQAKRCVEALPFNPEGHNRTKAILQDKYGKESEIIKCYVKEILDLPSITGTNPRKIVEFHDKLSHSVQALETMKKLHEINGNVSLTLDKLAGIRGDLVRTDPEWESWDSVKLVQALRQWVKRNPVNSSDNREREENTRRKLLNTRREDVRVKGCVYCGDPDHKAMQCEKIVETNERKKILARKGLCFNCAVKPHRAVDCPSKSSCQHCSKRHHSSICDKRPGNGKKLMTDGASDDGIFPVVVVKVNGIMCRALIDSGAGNSYASANLVDALGKKPSEVKSQRIDMLMASKTTRVEIYDADVSSLDESFRINVKDSKVDKPELLFVKIPKYDQLLRKHDHLRGVTMDDGDTKQQLPIHLILGNGEYARIKTSSKPLIGKEDGGPVAEKTKFDWVIMSPGLEFEQNMMLMTQTSQSDFDRLCRLDVLGLKDSTESDQNLVYEDFKEQPSGSPSGYYEASLPWKANHPPLPTNEAGNRRRLTSLVRKLKKDVNYEQYDKIICEQLEQGIIEKASNEPTGKEHYLPHKAVIRKSAETTKLRIVYDASAKEQGDQPSINECLNPGPPLQNLLWEILVRSRFYPVLLTSDIEKAFRQVRIKSEERDALRFFWRSPGSENVTIYRFT